MQAIDTEWSQTEQKTAKEAFDKAFEREISSLIKTVGEKANSIVEASDMWRLHDFLSARRHDLDGKYHFEYESLIFVFSQLVKEGWLHLNELEGLDKTKLAKIAALSRM